MVVVRHVIRGDRWREELDLMAVWKDWPGDSRVGVCDTPTHTLFSPHALLLAFYLTPLISWSRLSMHTLIILFSVSKTEMKVLWRRFQILGGDVDGYLDKSAFQKPLYNDIFCRQVPYSG